MNCNIKNEIPIVTVIIPLYNREDYIKETLKSVFDQTYSNIEIVIVDDGSTDNSLQIVNKYKKKCKIIKHPNNENKGQSAAINLALSKTRSKYISILDSDDKFLKDKLKFQVDFLEKNKDFGVVYSNGEIIDSKGNTKYIIYSDKHIPPMSPNEILLSSYFNVPSNALVRRSIYDKVGFFDESMRSSQDHDMAIRLSEVTKIGYLPQVLWQYRRHDDSQSGKHALRRWETGFKILSKAILRHKYPKNVIRKRRAVLHFRIGQCLFEKRMYFKSIFNLIIAGTLDPIRSLKVLINREGIGGYH
jgi:glycosyltransferase involved in cell wall biosynthesis